MPTRIRNSPEGHIWLDSGKVCTVVAATRICDGAVQIVYKRPDGLLGERILGRDDEQEIAPANR